VACEWTHDRFLVVWHYDFYGDWTDVDVRAQLVYGAHQTSGSQLVGNRKAASQDAGVNEWFPAVACNSDDATCLIVFEYRGNTDNPDIYGQRLGITASDASQDGDRFIITDYSGRDETPDVAWGPLDDNYLVVWSSKPDASSDRGITFSHVFDTEQGEGVDERQHEDYWLTFDEPAWQKNQDLPAVAYNPQCKDGGRYLVAFMFSSDTSWEIAARRISGTGPSAAGPPFFITSADVSEGAPRVASSGRADQFLVTFTTSVEDGQESRQAVHGQAVKGTHDGASGAQLDGTAFEIFRTLATPGFELTGQGGITGSPYNGRYAAVWYDGDSSEGNVYGQLMAPYAVHLPLVFRSD
jgi:hypothetical protein